MNQAQMQMTFARLDEFVFDKMTASRIPGLSLALVQDGELVYARGYGQRDLAAGLPATPDTLYGIGSVTKSFTAIAILQLVEQGKLALNQPVADIVAFPTRGGSKHVTLEHLLSHSSGLPALAYSEAIIRHAQGTGGRALPIGDPRDVLTFMEGCDDWWEAKPGERWMYLNEGYAALGLVVERISGQSFERFVEANILEPLGMTRTCFARDRLERDADRAVPYVVPADGPARPGRYLFRAIRSEGGLFSSVVELCRYARVFFDSGAGVISEESLRDMTRARVAMPAQAAADLFHEGAEPQPDMHYALGLHIEEGLFGRRIIGHGGSVLVSTAHMAVVAGERTCALLLANGSGYPLKHLAQVALALLLDEDPAELPFLKVDEVLHRLVGRYETYRGTMRAQITRNGDTLRYRVEDLAQPEEVTLIPERLAGEEPRFFVLGGGRRLPVTFRVREGAVELLYERYKLRRVGPL